MAEKSDRNKKYSSIEDFRKQFYPNSTRKDRVNLDSPEEFGTSLAERSLERLKNLLLKPSPN